MATLHSAKSLFDQNIQSAEECLKLYQGLRKLRTGLEIDWLLRASVIFIVSALDSYFHDKLKYRVGRYDITTDDLPPALEKFKIELSSLRKWDSAKRRGNLISKWVTDAYSYKPLQKREDVADALKLIGIEDLWGRVAGKDDRDEVLGKWKKLIKRRNQIAHEGDREPSRKSGKRLRPIKEDDVVIWLTFAKDIVARIERLSA